MGVRAGSSNEVAGQAQPESVAFSTPRGYLYFGLLEAIDKIDHILKCCINMSNNILLETLVCDSTDPNKLVKAPVSITIETIDHPISIPVSTRPSPFYVENYFKNSAFSFKRYFDADLNTPHHIYDWEHKNDEALSTVSATQSGTRELRRFWHFYSSKR